MTAAERWINGVVGGFIGGGAAAITSGPVASMIDPQKFNTGSGLHYLLEFMGTMFLVNGLIGAALYLKQHPTPYDGTAETDQRKTQVPITFADRRQQDQQKSDAAGAGK